MVEQHLPPAIPAWGNALTRAIGAGVLKLFGWRNEVELPNLPRFVIVAAPHTSNWDFVFGMATILALGVRVHWWGKHSLFRWPFKSILESLGGIAIDRSSARGLVAQTAEVFERQPQLILGLAPEGTRQRVERWKSGFYQVAQAAQVPIVLAYIDYKRRVVGTGPALQPSGDYAADLDRIAGFYASITARHPEQFASVA